jgi:hypothetical protein
VTSIPAVESALVDLFTATLTSTQVYYGNPTGGPGPRICVVGDGDLAGRLDVTSLGLGSTLETYEVPIKLEVSLNGSTLKAATLLVMADFAAAAAAVRDNPTLGINAPPSLDARVEGDFTLQRLADSSGQVAALGFVVHVVSA